VKDENVFCEPINGGITDDLDVSSGSVDISFIEKLFSW
jgi:hypothetical protein